MLSPSSLSAPRRLCGSIAILLTVVPLLRADVKTTAVRETVEFVTKKFSREVAEEGAEVLAKRIESLAVKHGDDALAAVRNVGPKALKLADEAGEEGAAAVVRALAKHGEAGVVWVASRPKAMELVAKYGDDAAEALVKHPHIAESTIDKLGKPAVAALKQLDGQNGRRFVEFADSATDLAKLGRTDEIVNVVAQYGNRAMNFIWNNKGKLAVASVLATFLANPEPYIDGTVQLVGGAVDAAAELPTRVAEEAAKKMDWTLVAIVTIAAVAVVSTLRFWLRPKTPAR